MRANELQPPRGAKHSRKRIGRGNATGQGTYAGKGLKGQKARSGNDIRVGFEGGQLPLIKRLSRKRGFKNRFRVEYAVVNLEVLERFNDGDEVTADLLRERGIIKRDLPIKVLGRGEFTKKLTVSADRVSASARKKIEEAGGTVSELEKHGDESSSSTTGAE
ncbi:MAG: 50S ribosomal protein L15 [Dehalococcoidia bacterium]